jgi:NDP-sugar pyrophosphorylase family protein
MPFEAPPGQLCGIVLAGAYPRGRSLFDRLLPRPLLPVAQRPIITYSLRWLAEAGVGIQDVTVCANGAARGVRTVLQGATGLPERVTFHEDWMPRGTAGCVRDAGLRTLASTFVVIDGTTVPRIDLSVMLEKHTADRAALTVGVGPRLIPAGVYIFDRRVLDYVGGAGFQDIKEALIPRLHAAGERVGVCVAVAASPRVFDVESYLAVNDWMIGRAAVEHRVPEGYELRQGSLIHQSARVSSRARLVGPLVIGPDATVEADATLVGACALGSGSFVGRRALVSRSVLWSNCRLEKDSLVDRCLIAHDTIVPARRNLYRTVEAGPLVARLDLDGRVVDPPGQPSRGQASPVGRASEPVQAT